MNLRVSKCLCAIQSVSPFVFRTIIDLFQVVKASALTATAICDTMLAVAFEFYANKSLKFKVKATKCNN